MMVMMMINDDDDGDGDDDVYLNKLLHWVDWKNRLDCEGYR